MDIKYVALQCHFLIAAKKWTTSIDECSANHCLEMCETIMHTDMDIDKEHRWLGWIQACMCMHGVSTLEELKNLNKNDAKKEEQHKQYAVYSNCCPTHIEMDALTKKVTLLGPYDTEQEAMAAKTKNGYDNDSTCFIDEYED